ncbi:hypothetical protein MUB24_13175 [Lederbergia sp. NSJ-179]|uniref:hypothetical protein n=1 Tax=Lederbergia sp. NSJ-179 TaxID=2931402 RepID=UPI001FD21780|nr:hypothetical protein [Lederbergia sp. NSJ-179]MCJ7841833.1 hypothetical protein [Lederbergia sp. NSJ-179]
MFKHYTMNQVVLLLDLEIKLKENAIALAINDLVQSIPEEAFEDFIRQTVKNELALALMAVNLRKSPAMNGKIVMEMGKSLNKGSKQIFIAWNLFILLFLACYVLAS